MTIDKQVEKLEQHQEAHPGSYRLRLDWGSYHIAEAEESISEEKFRDWLGCLPAGTVVFIIYRGSPPPLLGGPEIADTTNGLHIISMPDNGRQTFTTTA